MRYITIGLFFILIGCKTDTKNKTNIENELDKSVNIMWHNFITSNPDFKKEAQPESWYFHNNKKDANRLALLTLYKQKSASSGLYSWYKDANVDLQKIGTKHIITDFDGKAIAIIEITKVDTIAFNKITNEYAEMDMGTKIDGLKKWKKAHWDFFESAMEENGDKPTEEMLVVCERFKTIWPLMN